MLTIKQPSHNAYRPVNDLPTPPNTSQPSPPLHSWDRDLYNNQHTLIVVSRHRSPTTSNQPMSAPQRGLPPPAAMTLAQQAPPPGPPQASPQPHHQQQPPPQQHHQQQQLQPPPPPPPQHPQALGPPQLPPPPPWQHGGDDTMRAWLLAKAEVEKRYAEEERTRQETLRLEQRRTEHDILRTSLAGGIPPPMVPVVFAGMAGGNLPQAALEWAHQIMFPHGPPPLPPPPPPPPPHHMQQQQHQQQQQPPPHPQHLLTGPGGGGHHSQQEPPRQDPQSQQQPPSSQQQQPPPPPPPSQQQQQHPPPYGQGPYGPGGREGPPGSSGGGPGPSQGGAFIPPNPPSPTRPRGYTLPASGGRSERGAPPTGPSGGSSNLPTLNTNVSHGTFGQQQLDLQASPAILFHHWQPPGVGAGGVSSGGSGGGSGGGGSGGPGGSGGGSGQPSAPVSESPKKRKATGPQQAPPPPSSHQRFRSPPFSQGSGPLGNPPAGRRNRGHNRQRSDMSSYRSGGRGGYGGGRAGDGGGGSAGGPRSRGMSPSPYSSAPPSATGSLREGEEGSAPNRSQQQSQPSQPRSGGGHTVSSMLSEDVPSGGPYGQGHRDAPDRSSRGGSERHHSPHRQGDDARRGSATGGHGEGGD